MCCEHLKLMEARRRKSETGVGDSRFFSSVEVFGEIMRDPRWRKQFDLVFRPSFDARDRRLIGPPCSALSWECIQTNETILGKDVAVGVSQLYFDGTFIGQSTGTESGYLASLNRSLCRAPELNLDILRR